MELTMCLRFLDYDAEVFRNLSCTGPVDFIVLNKRLGELSLYDSKKANVHVAKDGTKSICTSATTQEQRKLGVELVTVYDGQLYFDKERIKVKLDASGKRISK